MRKVLLTVLLCLVAGVALAQNSNPPLGVRLSAPTRIRVGVESPIKIYLLNPYRDEKITISATATYMVGEAAVETTASTDIYVDRSLEVSLGIGLGLLSLVNGGASGSPTFDGVPVTPVQSNNNLWVFHLTIPADGNEHILEFKVIR